jgi:hypothetical protein
MAPNSGDTMYILLRKLNDNLESGAIGGASTFADLTGDPYDNPALAAALGAIVTGGGSVLSRGDITGLTGSAVTDLDSIITVGLAADGTTSVLINRLNYGGQIWQLQTGTDAENVVLGVVRPDDYGVGNTKIWVKII